MNRCYRLVWNRNSERWVVAHEHARSRGKRSGSLHIVAAAAAAVFAGFATYAHALPTGGQVSAGTGSIAQSGTAMTVTQGTHKLAVNWNSFGIDADESVTFRQPDSSAIALNRVLGTDPSRIYGRLSANGQVFLLNPNGLLFGPGAQVNVGGLVASTLNLSDSDFMAGRYSFSGSGGSVVNQGAISAADGGYVALLGAQVSNEGTIQARLGTVALAAGNKVTLDFAGDSLVSLQVDERTVDALAQNKQLIRAEGGTVLLTARAAGALEAAVVNNSGVIEAHTIENHGGVIRLVGDAQNGVAQVGGTLDASAPNGGDGGQVETSAAKVQVANGAVVTTAAAAGQVGTWLIDPQDFTISASGGDITGADLSNNLLAGNVTIQSSGGLMAGSGNVNVEDGVAWSTANSLTLTASNNINVNADINAIAPTSGLALNANTANGGETPSGAGSVNIVNSAVNVGGAVTVSGVNLNVGSAAESAPSLLQSGDLSATLGGNVNVVAGTGSAMTATVRSSGTQSISVGNDVVIDGGEGANSIAMIQSTGSSNQSVFVGGSIIANAGGNSSSGSGNKAYILKGGSGMQTVSAHSVHLTGGGGIAGGENKAAILTAPDSSASQQVFIGAGGLNVQAGSGAGAGNTAGIWVLSDLNNNHSTSATQFVSVAGNVSITGGSGNANPALNNNASIFQTSTGSASSQTVNVAGIITLTGAASGMNGGAYITSVAPSQAVSAGGIVLQGAGGADGTNDAAGIFQNNFAGAQSVALNGGGSIVATGGSGSGGLNTAQIYSVGSGAQTIDFASGGAINLTGGTGVIDSAAETSNNVKIEVTAGDQTISGRPSITIQGGIDGGSSGGTTNLGNFALIRADSGVQSIDAGAISLAAGGSGIDSSATIQGPMQTIHASSVALSGGGAGGTFSGARIGGRGGSVGGPTNLNLTTTGAITITGGTTSGAAIGANPTGGWQTDITINSGGDVTLAPGTGAGVRIGSTPSSLTSGNITITSNGNISLGQNGSIGSGIYTGGNVSLTATAGSITEQPASRIEANALTTSSNAGTLLGGGNQVASFNGTNGPSGDLILNDMAPALSVGDVWNAAPGGALGIFNTGAIDVSGNLFTADGGDLTLAAGGDLHIGNPGTGISVIGGVTSANTGGMTLLGANIEIDGGSGSVITFVGLFGSGTQQVTTPGDFTIAATAATNGTALLSANDGSTQRVDVGGDLRALGGEGANNAAIIAQNGSGAQTLTVGGTLLAVGGGSSSNGSGNNAFITVNGSGAQTVSAGGISLQGGGGASGTNNTAAILQRNGSSQNVTVNGGGSIDITGGSGTGGANLAQINSSGSGAQTIAFSAGGAINVTGGTGAIVPTAGSGNSARIDATVADQSITGFPSITVQGGTGGGTSPSSFNLGNFAFIRTGTGRQVIDAGPIALAVGSSGVDSSATIQGLMQTINASSVSISGGGASGTFAGARIGGAGGATNLVLTTAGPISLTGGTASGAAIGTSSTGVAPTDITINSGGDVTLTPGTGSRVRIGSTPTGLAGGNISITSQGSITLGQTGSNVASINTTGDVNLTANAFGGSIVEQPASVIRANSLTTVSGGGTLLYGTNQVGSFNATNYGSNDVIFYDAMPALTVTGVWNNAYGGNVNIVNSGDVNVTGSVFASNGGNLMLTAGGDLLIGNPVNGITVTDGTDSTNTGNMTLSATNISMLGGNGTYVGLSGSGMQQVTAAGNLTIAATASPNGSAFMSANDSATQSINVGGNLVLSGGDGSFNQAILANNGAGVQTISAGSITLTGGEGSNSSAMIMQNGSGLQSVEAGGSIIATAGGNSSNGFGNNAYIVDNGGSLQTVSANSIALAGGGGASGAANVAGIAQFNVSGAQSVTVNGGGSIDITGGSGSGGANFAQIFSSGSGPQTIGFTAGGAIDLTGGTGAIVSTAGTSNFARIEAIAGNQTISGLPSITIQGGTGGGTSVNSGTNLGNFAFIRADAGLQNIDAGAISLAAGASGIDSSATIQGVMQTINASSVSLAGGGASGTFSGARIGGHGGATGGPTNLTLTTTGPITLTGGSASGAGIGDNPSGGGPTEIAINAGGDVTLQPGTGAGVRIGSTAGDLQGGNISIVSAGNITLGQNGGIGAGIFTAGDVNLNVTVGAAGKSILEQAASRIVANSLTTSSDAGTLLYGANQVGNFNATNFGSGDVVFNDAVPALDVTNIWNNGVGGSVSVFNANDVNVTGNVFTADGGNLSLTAGGDLLIGNPSAGISVADGTGPSNTGSMTLSGTNIEILGGNGSSSTFVGLGGSGAQQVTATGNLTVAATASPNGAAYLVANDGVTQSISVGGNLVLSGGDGSFNQAVIEQNGAGAQNISAGNITLTGGEGANSSAMIVQNGSGAQTVAAGDSIVATAGGNSSNGVGNNAYIVDNGGSLQTVSANSIALAGGGGSTGAGNIAGIVQNSFAGTQTVTVDGAGSIGITGGSGSGGANFAQIYTRGSGPQSIAFTSGGSINLTGGTGAPVSTAGTSNFARIEATAGNQSITGAPSISIQGGSGGSDMVGTTNLGNFAFIRDDNGLQSIDAGPIALSAGSSGINNSATIQGVLQLINASSVALNGGGSGGGFAGARIGGRGGATGGPTNLTLTTTGPITLTGGSASGAGIGDNPSGGGPTEIAINAGGDVTLQPGTGAGVRIGSTAGDLQGGNISIASAGNITLGQNGAIGSGIYTSGDVSLTTYAGSIIEQPASVIVANSLTTVSNDGMVLLGANQIGSFNATNFWSGDIILNDGVPVLNVGSVWNAALDGAVHIENSHEVDVTGNVSTFDGGDLSLVAGSDLLIGSPSTGIFVIGGGSAGNTGDMTLSGANIGIVGGNSGTYVGLYGSGAQWVTTPGQLALTATAAPNGTATLNANDSATQSIAVGGQVTLTGGDGTNNVASISAFGNATQNITAGSIELNGGEGMFSSASIMQNGVGPQTVTATGSITASAGGNTSNGSFNNAYILDYGVGPQSVSANSISLAGGGGASGASNIAGIIQGNMGGTQSVTVTSGGSISITGGSGSGGANYAQIYSRSSGLQTIDFLGGGSIDLAGGTGAPVSTAATSNFARIETTTGNQSITGMPSISIQGGSEGSDYVGATNLGNFAFIRADNGLQSIDAGAIVLTAGASGINNSASIQGPNQVINASSVALTGGGGSGGYAGARIGGRGGLAGGPTNLALTTTGPITLSGGSTAGVALGANPSGGGPSQITIVSGGDVTLQPGAGGVARIGSPPAYPDGGDISITSQGNIMLGQNGGTGSGIYTTGNVSLTANTSAGSIVEQPASVIVANSLTTVSGAGTLLDGGNQVSIFNATNNTSGNISLVNAANPLTITGITNYGGDISVDNTGAVNTTGLISAPSGSVSIVAHSPLTIGAAGVSAAGDISLTAGQTAGPGDVLKLDGPVASTGAGTIVLFAGEDLLQNADVSSNGGSISATSESGNITMAAGTTTSSGGGNIGYAAPLGDINLSSLDAGTGAIGLSAGGNVQSTSGYAGVNLTGDSATVEAGGDVTLTTRIKRWTKVTAGGTVSVTKLHRCQGDGACGDEDDQGENN